MLEILWRVGAPMNVRQVLDELASDRARPLAYTTVMTVLSRLADKEVVVRSREGRGYAYEPAFTDPAAIAVRDVMREFGDAAVAHFVEEARGDPEYLRRLRRLLDEGQ